ncbi:MAG: O-methyltransferase [Paludibacteraceae bacterium]
MQLKQATHFDDYDALIDAYMAEHSDAEPAWLAAVARETHVRTINPRMLSGHFAGRILKMLVRIARPKRVLEIGAFTGYSALCLAEGLPADGHIDTIEIDDELEDFIRENIRHSPYAERVTLHIGDACALIPQLDGMFDFVFIDADKRFYRDYYELVLPKVPSGGVIVADNTLWDGKVLIPNPPTGDHQTIEIKKFNDFVAQDERVEKVILPLRDGLTLMMKK